MQSQVIRYLKGLAEVCESCHLVTFERDSERSPNCQALAESLQAAGIQWHPLTATDGNRAKNTLKEISNGTAYCEKLISQDQINLVHCRSFIPGNIGLKLKKRCGIKFLYDMRGLWVDEKRLKGTIKNPLLFRFALWLENRLFKQADAIVSLTQACKTHLQANGIKAPIKVIPCCVDVDLFSPPSQTLSSDVGPAERFISVGSLGRGYLGKEILGLYRVAKQIQPKSTLTLITKDSPESVAQLMDECGVDDVQVASCSPDEVPGHLANATIGLAMNERNFSKIATSPTKLAEYLACGLPVIANCQGIGDLDQLLDEHTIGVKLEDFTDTGYSQALAKLAELRADGKLKADHCRQVALDNFKHSMAIDRYAQLYQSMTEVKE